MRPRCGMLEAMDSTRLEVKVKPNARRNALTAKHFGCPRRAVTIKSGAASRRKVLLVAPQR
jgi:uncharacterized protein YggU (UPF0235/DUF167 family)